VAFYRELVFDELLGPYFEEVAEVDWATHVPKLIAYWCWVLLEMPPSTAEVTKAHRDLYALAPIGPDSCDRWYSLWVHSIDERWRGPNAQRAADHAATLMGAMAKRLFGFSWTSTPADRRR
jgi:hemoglobin